MTCVNVLFGNDENLVRAFGRTPGDTNEENDRIRVGNYKELAESRIKCLVFEKVATTLRESISSSGHFWSVILLNGGELIRDIRHQSWVVHRIGTRDAFAAGLIYGILKNKTASGSLSFDIAAACLKHSVLDGFGLATLDEAEALPERKPWGSVQR